MKKLILGVLLLSLTGCGSMGEIFVSASNTAYELDQNGGSVEALILKADLSAEEQATVIQSRETVLGLRDKFDSIEPETILTLHYDYLKAKAAYKAVYDIVVAHESEYTYNEWQVFVDAHAVALKLDDAINEYIGESDKANAANMVLQYLNAAAKLAAVL